MLQLLYNPPMDSFFSTFGKVILILFVVVILIGGGIYLGTKLNKPTAPTQNPVQNQTITQAPTAAPTTPVNPSPAQAQGNLQTINAGGFGSFPKYTISIPSDWQQELTVNNSQNLLTISKGQYQIQINQTAMGNGQCSYPGTTPAPMSQQYTAYVVLSGNGDAAFYRRSKSQIPYPNGEDQYEICQKNPDGTYSFVTTYGAITYMSPTNADSTALTQMDNIFESVIKQ